MYALPFIAFPLLFFVVIVVSVIFAVINYNDRRDDKRRQQRDKTVDVDADATVRSWIGQLQAPLPSQPQSSLASPTLAPQKTVELSPTTQQVPTLAPTPVTTESAFVFDDLDTPAVFRTGTANSQKWKSLSKLGNKEFDAALLADHKERLAKASKALAAKARRAKAAEQKAAHDASDDAAYQEEASRDPALLDEIERLQAIVSRDAAGH